MISRFKKRIIFINFILILSFQAISISLEDAQKLAKEKNRNYISAKLDKTSNKFAYYNSITNMLPKFYLSLNSTTLDENSVPPGGNKTNYTSSLGISQPIFYGGKLFLATNIAKLNMNISNNKLTTQEKELEYSVADGYFGLLKINELIEISTKSVESAKKQLEIVNQKYKLGMARYTDVLQWEVTLSNKKIELEKLKNLREVNKLNWKNLLNLSEEEIEKYMPDKINNEKLENEVSKYIIENENELQNFVKNFIELSKSSSNVKNMELGEQISKISYWMSFSEFLPTINLAFTKQFERDNKLDFDGKKSWSLVITANIPIFECGNNYTNYKTNYYKYKKAQIDTEYSKDSYFLGVKAAVYELTTSAKVINSQKKALLNAEENYNRSKLMYEQGMMTNNELLDSEIMYFNAQNQLVNAYYDFILNKLKLEKLIGGNI